LNKNRFNNLTSKEWLPFQKSWFLYESDTSLYRDNLRFFIKFDLPTVPPSFYYYSVDKRREDTMRAVATKFNAHVVTDSEINDGNQIQFAIFDLRNALTGEITTTCYEQFKSQILPIIYRMKHCIADRRFIAIFMDHPFSNGSHFPIAWDFARTVASTFSLKDEKIGCLPLKDNSSQSTAHVHSTSNFFYALYFRNDEFSGNVESFSSFNYFTNNVAQPVTSGYNRAFPGWFILRPPPRKKNEILHPAKFPEQLVHKYLEMFTQKGDNVFDPMSGTGSAQLAALQMGRNGYGTELNEFFCNIANERCGDYLNLIVDKSEQDDAAQFKILNKDVRAITADDFPPFDYIITSPPYWDMLNMKGAEYQARRREKGLQLNYSEDDTDLGNIANYQQFVDNLTTIYLSLVEHLKPGRFMTIVVKNVKKKGTNYPLAWDLAERLQQRLILLPESFWLQDDISIAPYGYYYTWVSNTFHHYCLSFQKPL
jgi:DNA modification methylase